MAAINWSNVQLEVLVEEVIQNQNCLNISIHSPQHLQIACGENKLNTWIEITGKINKCTVPVDNKTIEQVTFKWRNLVLSTRYKMHMGENLDQIESSVAILL